MPVSLRKTIFELYRQNNEITHAELCQNFGSANPKTLMDYLSEARKIFRDEKEKLSNVSIESLEPIILNLINKNPNTHNVKLALDLIKIKQSSAGMEDDIDISKFIIKVDSIVKAEFHEDNNNDL